MRAKEFTQNTKKCIVETYPYGTLVYALFYEPCTSMLKPYISLHLPCNWQICSPKSCKKTAEINGVFLWLVTQIS